MIFLNPRSIENKTLMIVTIYSFKFLSKLKVKKFKEQKQENDFIKKNSWQIKYNQKSVKIFIK